MIIPKNNRAQRKFFLIFAFVIILNLSFVISEIESEKIYDFSGKESNIGKLFFSGKNIINENLNIDELVKAKDVQIRTEGENLRIKFTSPDSYFKIKPFKISKNSEKEDGPYLFQFDESSDKFNSFENLQKEDTLTHSEILLDKNRKVIGADFKANEKGSEFVLGQDSLKIPANSYFQLKDKIATIRPSDGSTFKELPKQISHNDDKSFPDENNLIKIRGNNLQFPEGYVLDKGTLSYKEGEYFVDKKEYAKINGVSISPSMEKEKSIYDKTTIKFFGIDSEDKTVTDAKIEEKSKATFTPPKAESNSITFNLNEKTMTISSTPPEDIYKRATPREGKPEKRSPIIIMTENNPFINIEKENIQEAGTNYLAIQNIQGEMTLINREKDNLIPQIKIDGAGIVDDGKVSVMQTSAGKILISRRPQLVSIPIKQNFIPADILMTDGSDVKQRLIISKTGEIVNVETTDSASEQEIKNSEAKLLSNDRYKSSISYNTGLGDRKLSGLMLNVIPDGTAQQETEKNLDFVKDFDFPITPGIPESERKRFLIMQISEFEDIAENSFEFKEYYEKDIKGGRWVKESIKLIEPPDATEERLNAFFKKSGKDFQYGRDYIKYIIVKEPKQIFEYLSDYKGKSFDSLLIKAHGSREALGQSYPNEEYIMIEDLVKKDYNPKKFSNALNENGNIVLEACSTHSCPAVDPNDFRRGPTMAEYVTWLFQKKTTAATVQLMVIGGSSGSPGKDWGVFSDHWKSVQHYSTMFPEDNRIVVTLDPNEVNKNIDKKLERYKQ